MLALLGAAAAIAALAGTSGGQAAPSAKPVVIGWAFDQSGQMAPFDNPRARGREDPDQEAERQGRRGRP